MNHNPSNPEWFNLDKFILSNSQGLMNLYNTIISFCILYANIIRNNDTFIKYSMFI